MITQKESSMLQIVICSFNQHSSRSCPVSSPVLHIRDEMETEARVLSSGDDHLVGKSCHETGEESQGCGGLCWMGTQMAHCGATPNAALGKRDYGKLPGGGDNCLGFEGCI